MRWTDGPGLGTKAAILLAEAAVGIAVAIALGWSSLTVTQIPVGRHWATVAAPVRARPTPTPLSPPLSPTPASLVPTLTPVPPPALAGPAVPLSTALTADEAWQQLQPQLDQAWGSGPRETIALLQTFLARFPGYPPGQEKLYAALLASADGLLQQGQTEPARGELDRAQQLLPDRPEAPAVTAVLRQPPTSATGQRLAADLAAAADQSPAVNEPAVADELPVVVAAPRSPSHVQPPTPQPRPVVVPAPPRSPPRAASVPASAAAPTPTKVPFTP
ncbi:MAG: hypothetical protein E6I75_06150 [Chloroflexi bacterium]|nr:MAG: hypothetical protein E6I75_06150 [Chloroflexota bacterium]